MTAEEARRLALRLPDAVEQDHHGRPSFRVGGKIFATLWDARTMNVMVDEAGILHQQLAQLCDRVFFTVAGLPHVLKGGLS